MGTRLGKLNIVKNKKKLSPRASDNYYSTWVKLENGQAVPVLFTMDQIVEATIRAERNPEDVVGRSIASLILD